MSASSDSNQSLTRRRFFGAALVPALAAAVAQIGSRQEAEAQPPAADVLPRRFIIGQPEIPPLDSPIVFAREGSSNAGGTVEVLSLIQEEKGDNSFPWTLYAQLRTRHTAGDACVVCTRLHKDGPGWSTGIHSEVFARNWGVGIGVNIEVSNQYEGNEGFNGVLGIEMQSQGPRPALAGLQIEGKGGYESMVRLRAQAQTGIDLDGKCGVGLNLHGNHLRLDEGAFLQLDQAGQIRLRYHKGNIEFFNGDKRIAYLPTNAEDHRL
jgi:hypothetical protein